MVQRNGTVVSNTEIANLGSISAFGEDRDGELYIISIGGGAIYKFSGGTPPASQPFPQKLSETGVFSNLSNLTPSQGIIEYDVNVPLWSDNALKRRWIALPGTQTITFDPRASWLFPVGTVLVKHFELRLTASNVRRLETRVLIRENSGWAGYTYRWNDTQDDADLVPSSGATANYTISDNSGTRTQTWSYPSRTNCMDCHTQASGYVLGPRTRQLNRAFLYGAVSDNQLRSWNNIGLFSTNIGAPSTYEAYQPLFNTAATVKDRARAYLAVNCAQCHQPSGPAPGDLNFLFDATSAQMNLVGIAPTEGPVVCTAAGTAPCPHRASPAGTTQAKEKSQVWERMRRTDSVRMPKIGSSVVDPTGVDLIGTWIDQGAP